MGIFALGREVACAESCEDSVKALFSPRRARLNVICYCNRLCEVESFRYLLALDGESRM